MQKNMKWAVALGIMWIVMALTSCSGLFPEDNTKISDVTPVQEPLQNQEVIPSNTQSLESEKTIQVMDWEGNTEWSMKDYMMKDGDTNNVMTQKGIYTQYSPEAVENATGKIVLFFHAHWCPACVAIDNKINSEDISSDVTILKVNYDDSDDLKKKYWVTTQTTFVQIDKTGEKIKTWVWARDLADIESKLK